MAGDHERETILMSISSSRPSMSLWTRCERAASLGDADLDGVQLGEQVGELPTLAAS
jgi:hypothetical protein